jgi:hypothetical protein
MDNLQTASLSIIFIVCISIITLSGSWIYIVRMTCWNLEVSWQEEKRNSLYFSGTVLLYPLSHKFGKDEWCYWSRLVLSPLVVLPSIVTAPFVGILNSQKSLIYFPKKAPGQISMSMRLLGISISIHACACLWMLCLSLYLLWQKFNHSVRTRRLYGYSFSPYVCEEIIFDQFWYQTCLTNYTE